MTFLWVQIIIYCLISAALGAGLAYWWSRSRYEDVTESYARLVQSEQAWRDRDDLVTAETLEALHARLRERIDRVSARIEAIDVPPATDVEPLQREIAAVSTKVVSEIRQIEPVSFDFTKADLQAGQAETQAAVSELQAQLTALQEALEARVAAVPIPDLTPVQSQLGRIEDTLSTPSAPPVDLAPVEARLAGIETALGPTDLEPVHAHLRSVEARLKAMDEASTGRQAAFDKVASGIGAVASTITALRMPDLEPVHDHLRQVEAKVADRPDVTVDLTPLQAKLEQIEAALSAPTAPDVDFESLHAHLRSIEARLQAMDEASEGRRKAELDQVASGIAAVGSTITALRMPDLEPVHAHLRVMEAKIGQRPEAKVDLEPIHAHLREVTSKLDTPRETSVDLEPVQAQLREVASMLEAPRETSVNLEPVQAQLREVASMLEAPRETSVDLEPVQAQLREVASKLEAPREAPTVDLESVHAHLRQLREDVDQRLVAMTAPTFDLGPLDERLGRIETRIDAEPTSVDLGPVEERLGALHGRFEQIDQRIGGVDLDPVHARLVGLEGAIAALAAPRVDLGPVQTRIESLEQALQQVRTSFPTLEPLEARLAGLENSMLSIEVPEPDLSGVLDQVLAIEGRLDLASIENRLTAIEYGLAAVHHQLRSRGGEGLSVRAETSSSEGGSARATRTVRVERRSTVRPAPPPRLDPVAAHRRGEANLLTDAAFGTPDDLTLMDGVGDPLRDLFHDLGVYYFWQIAEWTDDEVAAVDAQLLDFRGRIERDALVAQARELAERSTSAPRPRIASDDEA